MGGIQDIDTLIAYQANGNQISDQTSNRILLEQFTESKQWALSLFMVIIVGSQFVCIMSESIQCATSIVYYTNKVHDWWFSC